MGVYRFFDRLKITQNSPYLPGLEPAAGSTGSEKDANAQPQTASACTTSEQQKINKTVMKYTKHITMFKSDLVFSIRTSKHIPVARIAKRRPISLSFYLHQQNIICTRSYISAGPSLEGPPGCEGWFASHRSAVLLSFNLQLSVFQSSCPADLAYRGLQVSNLGLLTVNLSPGTNI